MQRGAAGLRAAARKLFGAAVHATTDEPLRRFIDAQGITGNSLKRWCARNGARYVSVDDINGAAALDALGRANVDLVVYAGGGILRKPFLEAARRRVLNPHCGPLPEIRGMNAIEWAVLLRCEPGITLHYIDEGIDTGAIISRVPLPLTTGESVEALRQRAVVRGIEEIAAKLATVARPEELPVTRLSGAGNSRQCFVLAPALKELLAHRLGAR